MFTMATYNVCVNMLIVILTHKCYPFFRLHYEVTVTWYILHESLHFQSIIRSLYYLWLQNNFGINQLLKIFIAKVLEYKVEDLNLYALLCVP